MWRAVTAASMHHPMPNASQGIGELMLAQPVEQRCDASGVVGQIALLIQQFRATSIGDAHVTTGKTNALHLGRDSQPFLSIEIIKRRLDAG